MRFLKHLLTLRMARLSDMDNSTETKDHNDFHKIEFSYM